MHFSQVLCAIFCIVASVKGLGIGGYGGGYGAGSGGYGGGQEKFAPKPYDFGYAAEGFGGSSFRSEKGDGSGNVQGSYGYTDNQGLYRKVEYVANAGGFHASVKTNEPGTDGKENPADVQMNVQSPPAGVQAKYTAGSQKFGGAGLGGAGGASHYGGAGLFAGIPRSSSGKSGY